jgi:hypothetical protein
MYRPKPSRLNRLRWRRVDRFLQSNMGVAIALLIIFFWLIIPKH